MMADARSALGTSDGTKACQLGIMRPLKMPVRAVMTSINTGSRHPMAHTAHRSPAARAMATWEPSRTTRRSKRSASEPPMGPSRKVGMNWAKPARP
ncbi:MAG: hypothetical protein AAGK32_19140, partial [Actinomycetota bacterium]